VWKFAGEVLITGGGRVIMMRKGGESERSQSLPLLAGGGFTQNARMSRLRRCDRVVA
jgi:hypothetical protein